MRAFASRRANEALRPAPAPTINAVWYGIGDMHVMSQADPVFRKSRNAHRPRVAAMLAPEKSPNPVADDCAILP